MNPRFNLTACALAATFFYAAQHPLSRPMLVSLKNTELAWALKLVFAVMGVPLLIFVSTRGKDFVRILGDTRRWPHLLISTGLGLLVTYLYVWGNPKVHPVLVALLLNTSPLWAALWARLLKSESLPRAFVSTVFVSLLAIGGLYLVTNDSTSGWVSDPWGLLLLLVPGIYTLRAIMTARWFADRSAMDINAALTVLAAVLMLPLIIGEVQSDACEVAWNSIERVYWVELLVGTISGAIIGSAFYLLALQRSRGAYSFVTAFNLLIPSVTAMLSFVLHLVQPDVSPGLVWEQVVCIAIVLLAMWRFHRLNADPLSASVP